jgi:hypothetical protein
MNQEKEVKQESSESPKAQANQKKPFWKRILKFFMWLIVSLIVLVLLLLVTSPLWVGSLTATVANKLTPDYTGTKFNLEGAHLNIFSGNHAIRDLRLCNPEGFSATDAVSVASVTVGLSTLSLLSDTIHITDITVDSPYVSFLDENSTNNFAMIAANVDEKVGPKKKKEKEPGQKLALDKLKVSNIKMRVVSNSVDGKPIELTIADVSMDGFFHDDKDLSIKQLAVSNLLVKFEKSYWGVSAVRIPSITLDALSVTGGKKGPDGKKIEGGTTIDKLKLADVGLTLVVGPEIPLGDFEFTNIGKEEKKESILDVIKDIWTEMLKKAKSVGGAVASALGSLGESASNLLGNATGSTTNLLSGASSKIGDAISGGTSNALDSAKSLLNNVLPGGGEKKDNGEPGITDKAVEGVKNLGTGAAEGVKNLGEGAKGALKKVDNLFGN